MGRLALCAALCALAGCQHVPRLGYVELSPYAGAGTLTRTGSPHSAGSEDYGLMVTFGFKLENVDEKAAWENLARLDVGRDGTLMMHDHDAHDPVVVVTPGDEPDEGGFPVKEVVSAIGALLLALLTWVKMRIPASEVESTE